MFITRKRSAGFIAALFLVGALSNSASAAHPPTSAAAQTAEAADAGASQTTSKNFAPIEQVPTQLPKYFEVVPGKDPNGWSFMLEPYGWALGIDGTVGVGRFSSDVNVSSIDVLKHIDWFIFMKGEVRKGKWGVFADGFFAQLSGEGSPPGPLYDNVNLKIQQGMAELGIAYRVISDRRGFLDAYVGARYNYLGLNLGAGIDTAGVQDVGDAAAQRIVTRIQEKAQAIIAQDASILETDLENQIKQGLTDRVLEKEADLPHSARDFLKEKALVDVFKRVGPEVRNYVAAVAASDIAAAKSQLTQDIQNRVSVAQKKLAKAISQRLGNALPTSESASKWWIDPIIGLRGQINFTRWFFLALQGDVGGFTAGSQIAWLATGTLGINFTRNIFVEAGYRYYYVDYTSGSFTYKVAEAGPFMGFGVKF
jgi:hypothetical protein